VVSVDWNKTGELPLAFEASEGWWRPVSTVVVVVDMFVVVVVDKQQHLTSHVTRGPVPVIPITPWVRVWCYTGLAIPNPYPYPCVPMTRLSQYYPYPCHSLSVVSSPFDTGRDFDSL
jgi:hypothetical protein